MIHSDADIDKLVFTSQFGSPEEKRQAQLEIRERAAKHGAIASSIQPLYMAFGRGDISGFTVPAINVRCLTYDFARVIFYLMQRHIIGPVIFELAISEQDYTGQPPEELTASILAAAIKENFCGPIFMQGDHYQFKRDAYQQNPQTEKGRIKDRIIRSLDAGMYNIDIDGSTLVDLEKDDLYEQQKTNADVTAEMTRLIREHQPKGCTVSIGGEIGHIGGVNSTVGDFTAFAEQYNALIGDMTGISKVSVQTGTSHGGTINEDGSIARADVDFNVLKDIGHTARETYGMGGAVQHGASTLPHEMFHLFPEHNTLEIHLATGFQNVVFDTMPENLKNAMYAWLKDNLQDEWQKDWNEEQFLYKTRKKALGQFKQEMWEMPQHEKEPILKALQHTCEYIFDKLDVFNTRDQVFSYFHD